MSICILEEKSNNHLEINKGLVMILKTTFIFCFFSNYKSLFLLVELLIVYFTSLIPSSIEDRRLIALFVFTIYWEKEISDLHLKQQQILIARSTFCFRFLIAERNQDTLQIFCLWEGFRVEWAKSYILIDSDLLLSWLLIS